MITVRRARPDELQRAGELVFAAYDVEGYVASDPDPGFGAGLLNAAARAEHGEVLVAVAGSGELLGTGDDRPRGLEARRGLARR